MDRFPDDWERAVAVVPHPDDLEYGAASAIACWTMAGKRVDYVMVTSGEAGIDNLAPELAGPMREDEERRSARRVGVEHVEFLGHPDGMVEATLALRRDLANAFRRLRPEAVITMNFELTWGAKATVNHADHRATGLAVLDAVRDAANRWLFPEVGEAWAGIRHLQVFGTSSPTHFVDVAAGVDAGVASLREHQAYLAGLGGDFDPAEFINGVTRAGGTMAGCEHAVVFQRFSA